MELWEGFGKKARIWKVDREDKAVRIHRQVGVLSHKAGIALPG